MKSSSNFADEYKFWLFHPEKVGLLIVFTRHHLKLSMAIYTHNFKAISQEVSRAQFQCAELPTNATRFNSQWYRCTSCLNWMHVSCLTTCPQVYVTSLLSCYLAIQLGLRDRCKIHFKQPEAYLSCVLSCFSHSHSCDIIYVSAVSCIMLLSKSECVFTARIK